MTEQAIAYELRGQEMHGGELGELGEAGASSSGRAGRDADDPPAQAFGRSAAAQILATDDGAGVDLTCPLPRTGWTIKRLVRLAYLVGIGKSANEISFDPIVAATPNAIYKMMARLNLRFRDVPHAIVVRLGPAEYASLEREGERRGMMPDSVASHVVKACAADNLYGAILDR